MAALSEAQRAECWADFMRYFAMDETISITKTDLRTALQAADQWVSDNAASFNTALPQPARSALTASQKSRLLTWVVRWRYQQGVA